MERCDEAVEQVCWVSGSLGISMIAFMTRHWPLKQVWTHRHSISQCVLIGSAFVIVLFIIRGIWRDDVIAFNTSPQIRMGPAHDFGLSIDASNRFPFPPGRMFLWSTYRAGGPWSEWLVPRLQVVPPPNYEININIPYWIPLCVIGLAFWRVTAKKRRHLRVGTGFVCLKCGYNLTGNVSGKCPECGQDVLTRDR
jgi:hypothetical protein